MVFQPFQNGSCKNGKWTPPCTPKFTLSKSRASHTHRDLHLPLSALIGFFDLTVLLLRVDSPETVLPRSPWREKIWTDVALVSFWGECVWESFFINLSVELSKTWILSGCEMLAIKNWTLELLKTWPYKQQNVTCAMRFLDQTLLTRRDQTSKLHTVLFNIFWKTGAPTILFCQAVLLLATTSPTVFVFKPPFQTTQVGNGSRIEYCQISFNISPTKQNTI